METSSRHTLLLMHVYWLQMLEASRNSGNVEYRSSKVETGSDEGINEVK
jgi:hypothetical protein